VPVNCGELGKASSIRCNRRALPVVLNRETLIRRVGSVYQLKRWSRPLLIFALSQSELGGDGHVLRSRIAVGYGADLHPHIEANSKE